MTFEMLCDGTQMVIIINDIAHYFDGICLLSMNVDIGMRELSAGMLRPYIRAELTLQY